MKRKWTVVMMVDAETEHDEIAAETVRDAVALLVQGLAGGAQAPGLALTAMRAADVIEKGSK